MNKINISKIEILLSGIFFGTIPIFSVFLNRLEISSYQQVFFRITISILILLVIILLVEGSKLLKIRKSDILKFNLFGFFLTMAYFTYLSSISLGVSASEAVFLTYTQPFFVILLSKIILKEKITTVKLMAATLSIVGAAMILQIWMINTMEYKSLIGYFLAVLNGFFFASYIVSGRYIGLSRKYNFLTTTFWSFVPGLLWLIPGWFLLKLITNDKNIVDFSFNLTPSAWGLLFGLAFLGTVLPYMSLNKGLHEVKASQAGILLLVEPISVVLMGFLILQETLYFWQIVGALLTIFSVIMVNFETES
ncbi:MAG TPA: hypothetical protein C5S51_02800 [Methanosarcinaceae archaeon]|nr:hypothetical protein [Methanosarcinaceae archaeon]